jgi:DNA-binding GntR family transcriptional regulator
MTDLSGTLTPPRRTAHEYVRDSLRHAILRGTLRGGTRLVQADIAEELGVSTTPVREALRDLATEGLLRLDPHRGAIVHQFTFDEIREVQDLEQLLEPEAMRRVAGRISASALEAAAELADEMEVETDRGRWADLNRRFHTTLISDLEGTRLHTILTGLSNSAAPYIGLALQNPDNQLEAANHQHRALIDALSEGDADRAAELTKGHAALTIAVLERSRHLLESNGEEPA